MALPAASSKSHAQRVCSGRAFASKKRISSSAGGESENTLENIDHNGSATGVGVDVASCDTTSVVVW